MISALINIRLKQLSRGLIGGGLIRTLFLIGFITCISIIMFHMSSHKPSSYYLTIAYSLIVFYIHTIRSDKIFLRSHFNNYKVFLLVEYIILTIPLFLLLIYHLQWLALMSTLAFLTACVQIEIKIKKHSLNTKVQELIPPECFEWKAGIRRSLFLIIALVVFGIATSFHIASIPLVIFILGFIPFSFYINGESVEMLISFEKSPKKLLLIKLKQHILLFSIIVAPLILSYLIFNIDKWYIVLAEYICFITIQSFSILSKYASYEPGYRNQGAKAADMIAGLSIFLPVLIPAVWLLIIYYFSKSINNLNFYLDDFN